MADPISRSHRDPEVPNETEGSEPRARLPAPPHFDQSEQAEWVYRQIHQQMLGPNFLILDSQLQNALDDLATLSGEPLLSMLEKLDREGLLDELLGTLDEAQLESLFVTLEQKGLVASQRLPWTAGAWGVRPPPLLEAAQGVELPPSLLQALRERNARTQQDYTRRSQAFAAEVASGPTARTPHLPRSPLVPQPALARTPEEAARFQLGALPAPSTLLEGPLQAVTSGAQYVRGQSDLILRVRSLEVGDSTELQLGKGLTARAKVERRAKDHYEVFLALDALAGGEAKFKADLLALGRFEIGLASRLGPGGAIKLKLSSPEEFETLLVALKTSLQGASRAGRPLPEEQRAFAFLQSHVVGFQVGLKGQASASAAVSTQLGGIGLYGKIIGQVEVEQGRAPDGRPITTKRYHLQTDAKVETGLRFLEREDQRLTRVTIEFTTSDPPRPGEVEQVRLKVELEDTRAERLETRTLSVTVGPGELDTWLQALDCGDSRAVQALLGRSQKLDVSRTLYVDKTSLGLFSSTTRRLVRERKR